MIKVLILGAGGEIPKFLVPMLQNEKNIELTLFGRNAKNLSYENVLKINGNASNIDDLENVIKGQDIIYMNFDDKKITELVIKTMKKFNIKRIIQAGVLGVYGEVAEPFATWNANMLGSRIFRNRGNEALEESDLDYTYMRMTWLYNGNSDNYVVSPKGEAFLGAQITRKAVSKFVLENIIGIRNDIRESIGLWEKGSEYKSKPDWY